MDEFKQENKNTCSSIKDRTKDSEWLEKIIRILKDKQVKSGGNCGTYIPEILNTLNVDYKTLKPLFIQLYKEEKITVHKGGQGRLLKWKQSGSVKDI